MYCSTCGKSLNDNLNYCNACGARIEKNPLIVGNVASPQLAKSLAVIAMMGLVGFVAVITDGSTRLLSSLFWLPISLRSF